MTLDIRFADAPLGHEIRGIDLSSPLSEGAFAEIEAAFDTYGVVLFRGQNLTPDQQIEFSRRFGELEIFAISEFNLPTAPEILVVSNIVEDDRPIGMSDAGRYWHSDMWYTERPPRGSILYAIEVPSRDGVVYGDTMFASMAAAYDALSDELKEKLEGREAIFSYDRYLSHRRSTMAKESVGNETAQAQREQYKFPDIAHPIVRRHPRTGRKSLYLSQGVISQIIGLDQDESDRLVAALEEHVTRPEFVYRHNWRKGDVVMWDNCSAIHRAISDYSLPLRRRMHRTTIGGSAVI